MITDMSVGKPWRVLLSFSLPLLLSSMFQQMYNIADSVIAGRCIGENALAAVGASYPITMIFMAFAFGISTGASVVISQFFGAKKMTEMKTAVNTTFTVVTAASLLLTLIGIALCVPALSMMNTPTDIFDDSVSYLSIYIYGLIFLFLYNAATSVFSALGDSATPLVLLICSSLGNVILDLVCVNVFNMGVAGLALATLAAQGIAAVSATVILIKRVRKIHSDEKPKLFNGMIFGKITRMAIPSILQQSFVSVGNLFIQALINGFGSAAVIAGYSAAIKLNTFAITSFAAMSGGVSNFAAQNIGAGKIERVKGGFRAGIVMAEIIAAVIVGIILLFGKYLILLFVEEPTALALSTGTDFLTTVSPFYFFVCAKLVADSVLRGSGAVKCFMISTFADLILRVVLAYIMAPAMGISGVWWSWPFGWVIASGIALLFYFRGYWKNKTAL